MLHGMKNHGKRGRRKDGEGKKIESFGNLPEKILSGVTKLNYLLEGVDFRISLDGKIVFINNNLVEEKQKHSKKG